MLKPSDRVWIAILGAVAIYNVRFAQDGDTLSERVDYYLQRWPWLKFVIRIVARHLANDLDPRFDPIGMGFIAIRTVARRRRRAVAVITID